jgi:hypothetical protein
MATGCTAKNPTTCKVHGMGGSLERLEIDKAKAIRTENFAEQYNLQKQIDALKDEDPDIPQDFKANFFGKLGQKLFIKK